MARLVGYGQRGDRERRVAAPDQPRLDLVKLEGARGRDRFRESYLDPVRAFVDRTRRLPDDFIDAGIGERTQDALDVQRAAAPQLAELDLQAAHRPLIPRQDRE